MQFRGTTYSVIHGKSRASQHATFGMEQKISISDHKLPINEQLDPANVSSVQRHSRASMAQVHSRVSMMHKQSKVEMALMTPRQSRVLTSRGSRRSTASNVRVPPGRSSKVHQSTDDVDAIFSQMSAFHHDGPPVQDEASAVKSLATYFMGFWKAPHVAAALKHLEKLETKRTVRALQKKHGFWRPPPEVAEALKKPLPTAASNLPDTKDGRNLKFVLKVLGCSLQENKAYKQFQKAKTVRQKRNWLYKYHTASTTACPTYKEPICPTRLKRLYQFFPDRFTEEDGYMYFNNKMLTYDDTKNVYYVGKELQDQ